MIQTILAQGLGGLFMAGGLYAGAAVLCEVNTFEDIRTSISASADGASSPTHKFSVHASGATERKKSVVGNARSAPEAR